MRRLLLPIALLLSLFLASTANAHKPSDSYLYLNSGSDAGSDSGQIKIQWDIALRDLDLQLAIDSDANGNITWGELKRQQNEVVAYALAHLRIDSNEAECPLKLDDFLAAQHSDGGYVALMLSAICSSQTADLELHYSLLFDVDPTHRGLLITRGTGQGLEQTYILSPDQPTAPLLAEKQSVLQVLGVFVKEGVWHIWIGLDHILFLLALLLPVVWQRQGRKWQPVNQFRPVARSVIATVTMFTLAHSITLWLAVMGYLQLPAQWVEVTIAATIIVTVLHNFFPLLKLKTWQIAFIFGLIHGFGFANVLLDLGLNRFNTAISLFGFNVGVELGQLAIVIAFLPLAYWLRATALYRWGIFFGGSCLVLLLATIWFIERAWEISLLSLLLPSR